MHKLSITAPTHRRACVTLAVNRFQADLTVPLARLQQHIDPAVLLPARFVGTGRVKRPPRGDKQLYLVNAEPL